ncbi:MAG: hypothetical protein N3B18_11600 [Desulfobacterota bacterium]|nr:hypothetical protein [Thermodesulfobacteriota bacterium]
MKQYIALTVKKSDPCDPYFPSAVKQSVNRELVSMSSTLKLPLHDEPFSSICVNVSLRLYEIEQLYASGEINPFVQIRTGDHDPSLKGTPHKVRIGFYPVAADPFHWGHLLAGLNAIVHLKLDKVIYLIAGNDARKPGMTPAAIRHPMSQDVLRCFKPLFEYSPIAYDRDCDGEQGLFYFLKLNPRQPMDIWYLAGSDHYRRHYPGTHYPDTVQKLEDHIEKRLCGYNGAVHSIAVGFVRRGHTENRFVDTFLPVQFLPEIPIQVSSSMIREALQKNYNPKVLALVPYAAYIDIMIFDLYGAVDAGRRRSTGIVTRIPFGDISLNPSFACTW